MQQRQVIQLVAPPRALSRPPRPYVIHLQQRLVNAAIGPSRLKPASPAHRPKPVDKQTLRLLFRNPPRPARRLSRPPSAPPPSLRQPMMRLRIIIPANRQIPRPQRNARRQLLRLLKPPMPSSRRQRLFRGIRHISQRDPIQIKPPLQHSPSPDKPYRTRSTAFPNAPTLSQW